ncbi:hypothetical protein KX928_06865 [Roseobacter sp. YSTF-M11]|uniref:Excalibur calcium-binding domain-containing protein n=1 Tax=Roseobacter insulae TaxID=2859783 RepID=A0A9X1JZT5_9RHOB|nr:hypothetical protein [Roseobacter insulae]MBW4707504.1 hypothetical protein [Roseobacter insulae]
MTQRVLIAGLAFAVLSACAPQVPDSGQGVGFDNSLEAQQQREAALAQGTYRVPDTVLPPDGSAEATAAETTRILAATRPAAPDGAALNSGVAPVQASPANPAPVTLGNPGISDENDFDAVAERQTIESDAQRIASNAAQYEIVQPEALPERSGSDQPNIVAFALSTRHPKGQSVYARAGFGGEDRARRNCAAYLSPDQAQIDFLARGGPTRDRKGLDPDGDGYACGWDPAPFRKASNG